MPILKLTRRNISAIRPTHRRTVYYDPELTGFALRVEATGRMTYFIEYRPGAGGRSVPKKRFTIGTTAEFTPETARDEARRLLAEVRLGSDPAAVKAKAKTVPTFAAFATEYLDAMAEIADKHPEQALLRPGTIKNYRSLLKRHVGPAIGSRSLDVITRDEIKRLHTKIGKQRPTTANRCPGVDCFVDDAIREALNVGLLRGSLEDIRAELLVVCALAWGTAAAAYGARLAAPQMRRRATRVSRLADELLGVVDAIEGECASLGDFADGWQEKFNPVELANIRSDVDDLSSIVEHGRALIPLLRRYATQASSSEKSPPATNYLMRSFFNELGRWWKENALNVERRGAKAVRNRLAVGLWLDMGQEVPAGYSDEDFARRGFSLAKNGR